MSHVQIIPKKGHSNERARILLRAGEKLATELDIVRHKNQGLRKAVLHKKKKRKRGRAINLYDSKEKESQALFFSPAKIVRVRQRLADEEQAERRRKSTASDKKLQAAITRDEKAREAEGRKIARNLARQAARALLAQEKAERQAVRQVQRAQKVAETAKRKRDAAETKEQRSRNNGVGLKLLPRAAGFVDLIVVGRSRNDKANFTFSQSQIASCSLKGAASQGKLLEDLLVAIW